VNFPATLFKLLELAEEGHKSWVSAEDDCIVLFANKLGYPPLIFGT